MPASTATPASTRWPLVTLARELANQHADAGLTLGDLDADDSPLMDALGQTSPTTEENSFERWAARAAYQTVLANRLPLTPDAAADRDDLYRAERLGDLDYELAEV